jgi:mono/diheme cytochrome c family protein
MKTKKRWVSRATARRVGLGLLVFVAVVAGGAFTFGYAKAAAFDESVAKVYDVPPVPLSATRDPAAIARGQHLARSIAGCALGGCHGPDLSGGHVSESGPIGNMAVPNITNILPAYSDAELARLIRHGVKKDGRTVRWMTADSFNWLPDEDVVGILSWLRTMPPVEKTTTATVIKPFGKVMDRMGYVPIDIARRIDHDHVELGPAPSPTPEYGRWIARLCNGCHGPTMSGGPIPGAPPSFPPPRNLTPHATGIAGWSYDDLVRIGETGRGRDGRQLSAFMPTQILRNMDETERHALWAYLQSLPPRPFGGR